MYGLNEILADAQGLLDVQFVAEKSNPRHVCAASGSSLPCLDPDDARAFVGSLYAYGPTVRPVTVYRWYDTSAEGAASMLGRWWSPHRPSIDIDKLGLASMHRTARSDFALLRAWNRMEAVVEGRIAPGARIFFGRIAPQRDGSKTLGGGFIQFIVPRESMGFLTLERSHTPG